MRRTISVNETRDTILLQAKTAWIWNEARVTFCFPVWGRPEVQNYRVCVLLCSKWGKAVLNWENCITFVRGYITSELPGQLAQNKSAFINSGTFRLSFHTSSWFSPGTNSDTQRHSVSQCWVLTSACALFSPKKSITLNRKWSFLHHHVFWTCENCVCIII